MDEKVLKILADLELDWPNDDLGIDRELLGKIELRKDLVLVIQGVRRSGKSTLMKQIIRKLELGGQAIYVDFEDPRFADQLDYRLLDTIVKYHESEKRDNYYYFFDEIQNIDKWEKWLHMQVEKKKRFFIISGSNSTLLSGRLATALTGRHRTIEVFPFSYFEFCDFFRGEKKLFERYMEMGGFPLALYVDHSKALLREYFTDIIERDVKRNVGAGGSRSFSQLAKALFESTGSETSFRNLSRIFEITVDTVKKYVEGLESAYLLLSCPYFTYSERKSVVRPKKYYPIDVGIYDAIIVQSEKDIGKKLEIIVFHCLRRKYREVYYWRGKGEVDFVVVDEKGVQPIQVTVGETKERHMSAFVEFKKEFPNALEPMVISMQNVEEFMKC